MSSLHLWSFYGLRSQVWLYRLLQSMHRYPAHLLMRRAWMGERDLSEFPWPADRMTFFPERARLTKALAKIGPWLRSGSRHALNAPDTRFIRALAAKHDARIVHIHFGWLACSLLADNPDFGIPICVSFYGADVFTLAGRERYARELRKFLPKGYPLLVTSQCLRQGLIGLGAAPDRVRVVPVGIDMNDMPDEGRVRERCSRRMNAKPIRIITVGRLIDFKAPQALPEIARLLTDRGLDFEWSLIGDGPLLAECMANCERLALGGRFKLMGSMPFAQVRDQLWQSDIMVHNAVIARNGGRETLGVTLLEAQALGIPVVSCKVGGIPEAVADGETGYLVEPGDPTALADKIMLLADDPPLRHKMSLAGMRRVREHFDSSKLAMTLEAVYDSLRNRADSVPQRR